jgi:hypothetical protein
MSSVRIFGTVGVFALAFATASVADAKLRKAGSWPEQDKKVTLDGDGVFRDQAVRDLGQKAGWSLVIPWKDNDHRIVPQDRVDVHVKDEPADKVLEMLLGDGSYVATRDGNRVMLALDEAPPPAPVPSTAPTPAPAGPSDAAATPDAKTERVAPTTRGEDRTISGGHLEIRKDEIVHDVGVFGGSLDVYGTVTGDVAVTGGSVRIHEGAWVMGSATAIGGSLRIEDGARVDGRVGVVGGSLKRGNKAIVGGKSGDEDEGSDVQVNVENGKVHVTASEPSSHKERARGLLREAGDRITATAFLFVFGTILLALAGRRMEILRAEAAARPMRSLALGIVGSLLAVLVMVVLAVTVVGIPVLIAGVLVGVFAVYAGLTAALTTLGQALIGHKTKNPYAHLGLGCLLLLVLGSIPFVGGFVHAAAYLIGIGTLFATRGAGLVPERRPPVGLGPAAPPA